MGTNTWIALLSFSVAVLAASYARWAAMAARRQNEIAIHNERLKIFKAFLDFRTKLTTYGTDISEKVLYVELFPQVQLAEFYYGDAVHVELKKFFDSLSHMVALREVVVSSKDQDIISKKHTQLNICRTAAKRVEGVMKSELRLMKTERERRMNRKIIAREWLLFAGSLFIPLCMGFIISQFSLSQVYDGLFEVSRRTRIANWAFILAPYIIIQFIRSIYLSFKILKSKYPDTEEKSQQKQHNG